jgi:hypothetical protein
MFLLVVSNKLSDPTEEASDSLAAYRLHAPSKTPMRSEAQKRKLKEEKEALANWIAHDVVHLNRRARSASSQVVAEASTVATGIAMIFGTYVAGVWKHDQDYSDTADRLVGTFKKLEPEWYEHFGQALLKEKMRGEIPRLQASSIASTSGSNATLISGSGGRTAPGTEVDSKTSERWTAADATALEKTMSSDTEGSDLQADGAAGS